MNRSFCVSQQRGFSLIEVMISALIISVGLLALAKFQGDLLRSGSDAKARSLALALAQEKMDDLRDFQALDDGGATWTATYTGDMFFSWIASHEGGRLDPTTAYSAALESGGVQFTRDWVVSPQTLAGTATTIDYNVVDITVAWQQLSDDNTNTEDQSVTLRGIIARLDPRNTSGASATPNAASEGPDMVVDLGAAPEVIPVTLDVGEGLKKETGEPRPEMFSQDDLHVVSFDVITYVTTGTNQGVLQRREEFQSVNCRCVLNSGSANGWTPATSEYNSDLDTLVDVAGQVVSKQTGSVLTTGPNGKSSQPNLCTECCRDHHDYPSSGAGSRENSYDSDTTGPHSHYLLLPSNWQIGDSLPGAATTGGAYDEACRFKKVDGVWRVFWDWDQKNHVTLPADYLNAGTSTQSDYIDYVADYVEAIVTSSTPPADLAGRDTTISQGASEQVQSRSLYLDYMTTTLTQYVTGLINGGAANWLAFVPFYEINTTGLAHWKVQEQGTDTDVSGLPDQTCGESTTPADLAGKVLCVANHDIQDFDNYERGLAVAGDTDGTRDVQSYMETTNGGMVDIGWPGTLARDEIQITVGTALDAVSGLVAMGPGKTNGSPSGRFNWSSGNLAIGFSGVGGNGSGSCSPTPAIPEFETSVSFNCDVGTGWVGTITLDLDPQNCADGSTHGLTILDNVSPVFAGTALGEVAQVCP